MGEIREASAKMLDSESIKKLLSNLYEIPQHSLTVLEIYGGTAAGLEALLKTGHYIHKYTWADTNPDAHTSVKHRLTQLHLQYPLQLPLTSITQ